MTKTNNKSFDKLRLILNDQRTDLTVWNDANGNIDIEYGAMYNYPELDLDKMQALGKFFGTKKIAIADRSSRSGCETCDYGSCYTLMIQVRGAKRNRSCTGTSETR